MQSEAIFQTIPEYAQFSQGHRRKNNVKQPCNIELKISMKMLFHYTHLPFLLSNPKILKGFLKTFPTKMKPKCPAKEKKKEAIKEKKEGRRESEK